MSPEFVKELAELINRHSVENGSNTPDFILARYLAAHIVTYNATINAREEWYGRDGKPGEIQGHT